jgi:hypothetical protein
LPEVPEGDDHLANAAEHDGGDDGFPLAHGHDDATHL